MIPIKDVLFGVGIMLMGLLNAFLGVRALISKSVKTSPGIIVRGMALKLLGASLIIAGVGLLVYGSGFLVGHSFQYLCFPVQILWLTVFFSSVVVQRFQGEKSKR